MWKDNVQFDNSNENDDNSNVPNDVQNASNINNLGGDYEQEILHSDIYDPRNRKYLHNRLNYILIKKGPTREMNLFFPTTDILGISHIHVIQEN